MNDGRHIIWTDDLDYDDWKADLEEQYPDLTDDESRYALKRLGQGRVLTKGQFNESRFDRTNWYAFTEFGQALMAESEGRTQ